MTFSYLILTVRLVFNGYRIAAGPEKVTGREIEFGLSRDGLCGQPTGSDRINRSVDALFGLLGASGRYFHHLTERRYNPQASNVMLQERFMNKISSNIQGIGFLVLMSMYPVNPGP
jgi:hypothetical protein